MKKYEVINPFLAFRVNETQTDCTLKRGDLVELPETNPAVQAMVARGQLKEITSAPEPAEAKKKK